jgi:hypothetical protein
MFVQVIQGQVKDATAVREAMTDWMSDLSPNAVGWLGSTAGVTSDGQLLALARFESADAARRNSERPEQSAWWESTSQLLDGEATFLDSEDVVLDLVGNPDDAGFVQVIQGRGSDPDRARELMNENSGVWADFRPDILGSLVALHDDGNYTMAIYFTSEAEAREGEKKEPPAEMLEQMQEMNALEIGEPRFFDLTEPWLHSPG